jgi:itaconate CoA-transferase
LISITGPADAPSRVGISVADIAAGMYAYSGILTALIARAATGRGTLVEVSLFDALAEWMAAAAYYTAYGGSPPPRSGPDHASIAPYGPYADRKGRELYLGIQNAREWTRFCADVLQQPALADDDRFRTNSVRVKNRKDLSAAIAAVFKTLTTDEIVARLETAQIAYARMNSVEEFIAHPQLVARDRWREIGSPAGPLRALLPPVALDAVEPVMGPVPALGEHSDRILQELGFDAATIARWREERTI